MIDFFIASTYPSRTSSMLAVMISLKSYFPLLGED